MHSKIRAIFLFFIISLSVNTCVGCSVKSKCFLRILRIFCPCFKKCVKKINSVTPGSVNTRPGTPIPVTPKLRRKDNYMYRTTTGGDTLKESEESGNLAKLGIRQVDSLDSLKEMEKEEIGNNKQEKGLEDKEREERENKDKELGELGATKKNLKLIEYIKCMKAGVFSTEDFATGREPNSRYNSQVELEELEVQDGQGEVKVVQDDQFSPTPVREFSERDFDKKKGLGSGFNPMKSFIEYD